MHLVHPIAIKFFGVIYTGKLYVHPQLEEEVNFLRNFFSGGEGQRVI